MKLFLAFIILFALACSSIFGLRNPKNEEFIQGKWSVTTEPVNTDDTHKPLHLEWEFKQGKFRQAGFTPILPIGSYKVSDEHGDMLKLKLFKQNETSGKEDAELEILIDRKGKKLKINGKSGFKKTDNKENQVKT